HMALCVELEQLDHVWQRRHRRRGHCATGGLCGQANMGVQILLSGCAKLLLPHDRLHLLGPAWLNGLGEYHAAEANHQYNSEHEATNYTRKHLFLLTSSVKMASPIPPRSMTLAKYHDVQLVTYIFPFAYTVVR